MLETWSSCNVLGRDKLAQGDHSDSEHIAKLNPSVIHTVQQRVDHSYILFYGTLNVKVT